MYYKRAQKYRGQNSVDNIYIYNTYNVHLETQSKQWKEMNQLVMKKEEGNWAFHDNINVRRESPHVKEYSKNEYNF